MRRQFALAALVLAFHGLHASSHRTSTSTPPGFLENKGQFTDIAGRPVPSALFKLPSRGLDAYVTTTGLTYVFRKRDALRKDQRGTVPFKEDPRRNGRIEWVNVRLEGASIRPENIVKEMPDATDHRYFLANCPNGITGVHSYGRITIKEVYPGIDWVLYTNEHGMKYDFIAHEGADISRIALVWSGAAPVKLDPQGELIATTGLGRVRETPPVAYMQGTFSNIPCRFEHDLLDDHRVRIRFAVEGEPTSKGALVIDPQIVWATYTATDDVDAPQSVRTNSIGQVFTAGWGFGSATTGFPYPFDTLSFAGAFQEAYGTMYINGFDPNGVLLWSTRYQGPNQPFQMTIDGNDRILLAGNASAGLATASGTGSFAGAYYNDTYGGGVFESDAFILAFDATGNREWCSYLGGYQAWGIATDASNRIILTADPDDATNLDQPPTGSFTGAFYQPVTDGNAILMGFSSTGALEWATGFPGMYFSPKCVCISPTNKIVIAAHQYGDNGTPVLASGAFAGATTNSLNGADDGYICAFSSNGVQEWGTFFELGEGQSMVTGSAVEPNGRIIVTANTSYMTNTFNTFATGDFAGAYIDNVSTGNGVHFDPVIYGFNAGGVLQWASLLGGSGPDQVFSTDYQMLTTDGCGNIFASYVTMSSDEQTLSGGCNSYYDGVVNGGPDPFFNLGDIKLMRFSPNGALTWSTYYGGPDDDFRCPITATANGDLYLTSAMRVGAPLLDPGNGAWFQDDANVLYDDSYVVHFTRTSCEQSCTPYFATAANTNEPCTDICSATATVQGVNGTAPYSYAWSNGQTTATATDLCAGDASVTITDANGNTAQATVTISQPPPLGLVDSVLASSCGVPTGEVQLYYAFGGTPDYNTWPVGYDVLWSNGDTLMPDTIYNAALGTYWIQITDGNGCVFTDTLIVEPISQPTASVTAIDTLLEQGESTYLFANGGVSVLWEPPTGLSCTNCTVATATPEVTTTYCVVAFDANQCTDTACVTIEVEKPCGEVFVPNAFSPDNSGKNDLHLVMGDCITAIDMAIYDRWGTEVFRSSDPKTGWDGTNDGSALSAAVYVYQLTATLKTGETMEQQGNITLFR